MANSRSLRSGVVAAAIAACAFGIPARSPAASGDNAEALRAEVRKTFRTEIAPFLTKYCIECHGERRFKGGVSFNNALKRPEAGEFRKRWQLSAAKVKTLDMPPDHAARQPTDKERRAFADWVGTLKFLSPKDPGPFVIRRLTKAEYANTLHDLLGVDPAVAAELPEDVAGEGYLNTLSPLQTERYLAIADAAIDRALGPEDGPPTEVRRRLFGGPPAPGGDPREAARTVARSLARAAYRRPASEEEIGTLVKVFDLAQADKRSYTASLRLMLKAALVSPQFLFITPAKEVPAGEAVVPLDDHQLASRLSYFLWATMPDAELSALADAGRLREPSVLRAQVKRMLADGRSRALFDGFGAQWLGVGGLARKTFDAAKFPQMTPEMRTAMYDEVRLFFDSVVRENRSVVALVDSDYTYLNGTVAALYGMQNTVAGPEMRRVTLTDPNRGGILGMPAVLAMTSLPERTSPVKRGVWVLEQVLGEHVPPPPANVPALEKQDRRKVANLTLRQRTELHRNNPSCAACHKVLDPIGFGLENFDAIGRWRDNDDSGGPIDAAGELPDGKRFASPKELKALVAGRKDALARNLTEKLLAYALCRQLEGYDEIVVDHILETVARDDHRIQTVITEIVVSYPFLNRRVEIPRNPGKK